MTKTLISAAVTISSSAVVLVTFLASPAATGTAAPAVMKAPSRALQSARALIGGSPTSTAMSARTVTLPLDEFTLTTQLPSVHFDFASAAIRPADRAVLDANAEWLKANSSQPVAVEGAADPRGPKDFNLALGERRARAVRDYLIAKGVAPERITILSAGDLRPACNGQDCWPMDRRVDFLVRKLAPQAP